MARKRAEALVKLTFEFDDSERAGYDTDGEFVRHILGNQMELEEHDQIDVTVDDDTEAFVQVNVEYADMTIIPA